MVCFVRVAADLYGMMVRTSIVSCTVLCWQSSFLMYARYVHDACKASPSSDPRRPASPPALQAQG